MLIRAECRPGLLLSTVIEQAMEEALCRLDLAKRKCPAIHIDVII